MGSRRILGASAVAAAALLAPWCYEPRAEAFRAGVHADVTGEALADPALSRDVGGTSFSFSRRAILEIQVANLAEDGGPGALQASHHFDDERIGDASQRLVDLKRRIVQDLSGAAPDGFSARRRLGSALHAIQDFYSHTNWLELGNAAAIQTRLGRDPLPTPAATLVVCDPTGGQLAESGLTELTSGYFDLTEPCTAAPAGKCLHGTTDCEGLHKDFAGRPGFESARELARLATIDYVNQVLDAPGIAGNRRALRALMGRGFPLAFAIDDSGSMAAELPNVGATLREIVAAAQSLADDGASLSLTTVGATDGAVRTTTDPAEFTSWLGELAPRTDPAEGPEACHEALMRSIARTPQGATLFLVTDASCSDASLAPLTAALANSRGVRVVAVATGPESQADASLRQVAEATGGAVVSLAESDAGAGLGAVRALVNGELQTVVAAEGTLAAPREIPVLVECGVTDLVVTATAAGGTATLLRPDGTEVADAADDAVVTPLSGGALVRVTAPAEGTWRVRLTGAGRFAVRAEVAGAVALREVDFVERTSGPHALLQPVGGSPASGAGTLAVVLDAATGPVAFELVGADGTPLGPVTLAQTDPDSGSDRFVGTLTVPSQPFRVAATGEDATGCPFRRTFPRLFQPSPVRVTAAVPATGFVAGATTTVRVTVTDSGAGGTYAITAADGSGRVTRVEPSQVVLPAGGSAEVDVDVTVPGDAAARAESVVIAATPLAGTGGNTLTVTSDVGTGTIDLRLRSARAQDRRKPLGDSFQAAGTLRFNAESTDGRFDPATDDVTIEVGDPAVVVTIPAGDVQWKTAGKGRVEWKSPKDATPKVRLAIDPRRGTFALSMSRFDFPERPRRPVRVTVRAGDDVGTAAR